MKQAQTLEQLVRTVVDNTEKKADYIVNTEGDVALIDCDELPRGVALIYRRPDVAELQRYECSDYFHQQIAGRLKIPSGYYFRLLQDHRPLLLENVNTLLRKEPALRMIRTIRQDGRQIARAFLSNRFLRIDNEDVLAGVLPVMTSELREKTDVLSSYVDSEKMFIKACVTGDDMAIDLGPTARDGKRDIVRPGFVLRNDECGGGTATAEGFFYRDYCRNGCVFGRHTLFSYSRRHVGAAIQESGYMSPISAETRRLETAAITSAMRDAVSAVTSSEYREAMRDHLLDAKDSKPVASPVAAVEALGRVVSISRAESTAVLENLLRDGDLTRWGMANAVTRVANSEDVSYRRACELEDIGARVLDMQLSRWNQLAAIPAPLAA